MNVDWPTLSAAITGDVIVPDSPTYEQVYRATHERFHNIRPQAIVRCRTAADVARALAFTRDSGLPMAIRSGGHDFAGRSSSHGVIIDLSRINYVALKGTIATIGAGTRLATVYDELDLDGRAIPAGSGPSVAIAGLALGGGLGVLGRSCGLTCDSLVRAQIVLADGSVVVCDAEHEPDLFWALHGAGAGYFGIVTDLAFSTIAAPCCTVFTLSWDFAHADALIAAWQAWAPDAPDPMAASLLLNVPANQESLPSATVLGAAPHLSPADTDDLLNGLIKDVGAAPRARWRTDASLVETTNRLANLAPGEAGGYLYSKSEFFDRPLTPAAIADLLARLVNNRAPGEAREMDFSPWGGAYNRVSSDATAFPHRTARFVLKLAATIHRELRRSGGAAPTDWLTNSWRSVHPAGTGGVYPNFPDPDLADPPTAYFGTNLPRLNIIKKTYDPEHVFGPPAVTQPVPPTLSVSGE